MIKMESPFVIKYWLMFVWHLQAFASASQVLGSIYSHIFVGFLTFISRINYEVSIDWIFQYS